MAKIKGLDQAYRQLQDLRRKSVNAGKKGALTLAKLIAQDAQAGVPVDLGMLKASIGTAELENGAVVYVGEAYGAFQEFGTGIYVSVPPELAEEAQKFKGYKAGNSSDFIEEIRAWCVRHGIDERAAYPIAMSILRKGLKPQPYFYPAIQKNKDKLVSLVQQELDKI